MRLEGICSSWAYAGNNPKYTFANKSTSLGYNWLYSENAADWSWSKKILDGNPGSTEYFVRDTLTGLQTDGLLKNRVRDSVGSFLRSKNRREIESHSERQKTDVILRSADSSALFLQGRLFNNTPHPPQGKWN